MSDEQTPPPTLRLKPRLRPAESETPSATPASASSLPVSGGEPSESAPPPPVPAGSSAGSLPAADAAKIRLKPRLMTAESTAVPDPAAGNTAAPGNAAAAGSSPLEPPAAPSEPAVQAAPVTPIRLQPRVQAAAPSASSPAVPDSAPVSPPAAPPPVFKLSPPGSKPPAGAESPAGTPAPPPVETPAASSAEGGKFKLKPKVAAPPPPAGGVAAAPPGRPPAVAAQPPPATPPPMVAAAPPPLSGGKPPAVGAPPPKPVPPPFPVVASAQSGKAAPAVPHVQVAQEVPETAAAAEQPKPKRPLILALGGIAALLVCAGGFFAWQSFMAPSPAPPPPVAKQKAPPPPASTVATPSETLNNMAKAPANAVNRANAAIEARAASGQSRIDVGITGENAPGSAASAPGASSSTTGVAAVSPGISATTALSAVADASPTLLSFVANAKISGVVPARTGRPPVAIINGRLVRGGEIIDAGLGISFDGVDAAKSHVIFKDSTGATAAKRY